jgi:hypothetical protein
MLVTHANLPLGTTTPTVVSITATTVTLSGNAVTLIASGQTVYFGNCPLWLNERSTALTLGLIIYDETTTSLQICSVAGTTGTTKPTFSATAGTTVVDNTVTWTSLGLASNFARWAAPHAKLQNILAGGYGGVEADIFIAHDHAQTQAAAISSTSTYTSAAPANIWCVDSAAALPTAPSALRSDPYTTTNPACAQITTTGANGQSWAGAMNMYGIVFNCGSGAVTSALNSGGQWGRSERCSWRKLGTSGATPSIVPPMGDLVDCTFQFGSTGDGMRPGSSTAVTRWLPTSAPAIIGAVIPTVLMTPTQGKFTLEGVDFSNYGTGRTIAGAVNVQTEELRLIGIKVGSGVTIAATPTVPFSTVDATWVDSAGTNYEQGRWTYQGTLTQETTIVRSGGASDGTTPLAHRIVTTANAKWILPFESFVLPIWNSVTGSPRTLTVYGIWGGTAVPTNDEIWIDVSYFSDTNSPILSTVASTKNSSFNQGSLVTADGSTWGGSTTAFRMSVTFTAQLAGYVRARVKAARPSATYYIDPLPVLS